jgi:hypothetical protein
MSYTLLQQKIILFYLFANLLTLQIQLIYEFQQCKKLSRINKIQDTDEIVMIK